MLFAVPWDDITFKAISNLENGWLNSALYLQTGDFQLFGALSFDNISKRCNRKLWNIFSEVRNKLQNLKRVRSNTDNETNQDDRAGSSSGRREQMEWQISDGKSGHRRVDIFSKIGEVLKPQSLHLRFPRKSWHSQWLSHRILSVFLETLRLEWSQACNLIVFDVQIYLF